MGRSGTGTVVDRATLVRAAAMTAALGLVVVVLVIVIGPALVQALGGGGAKATAATLGVLARVAAGMLAGAPARRRGATTGSLLISSALGGLIGYLVFPGSLSVLGLATTGAAADSYAGLAGSAALGAVACAAGALSARPRTGTAAPAPAAAGGRRP